MIYKNKFGEIDILNSKYNFNNKTIAISMSGGCDSTMLCYLLAKTIQKEKLNIIIQPYNGYDIDIPHDSENVPNIIKYMQNKFPGVIRWPMGVVYKTLSNEKTVLGTGTGDSIVLEDEIIKQDLPFKGNKILFESTKDKNFYIHPLRDLIEEKVIGNHNGITIVALSQGPPLKAQQDMIKKYNKVPSPQSIQRIKGYYDSEDLNELPNEKRKWYNHVNEEVPNAPFKFIDKRFIIQCYKDFKMMDVLNEMTESCTKPGGKCGTCWWCREREWAMEEVC